MFLSALRQDSKPYVRSYEYVMEQNYISHNYKKINESMSHTHVPLPTNKGIEKQRPIICKTSLSDVRDQVDLHINAI